MLRAQWLLKITKSKDVVLTNRLLNCISIILSWRRNYQSSHQNTWNGYYVWSGFQNFNWKYNLKIIFADNSRFSFPGNGSNEHLPMVIRVPKIIQSPTLLCERPYSLLGFGDILLPGTISVLYFIRAHSFCTYAKISEKLTFLTPWYTHARVQIRGKMLAFRKILRMYWINDS